VAVRPDGYVTDPVEGLLVGYDVDDVAIARHDARLGDTVVHLPRLGYTLSER
jgi:hypothetical protein